MIHIKEAIIVEGRYDINTVRQIVDTVVMETGGFRIFNDKDRLRLIRKIAEVRGIIVLTDSDGAGFVIRNFLKGAIPTGQIKHAYIPEILGKEPRKPKASSEGTLGVEGMRPDVILRTLRKAGATILEEPPLNLPDLSPIKKADFFAWGLSGQADSANKRQDLLRQLDLPTHMTANALLEYINAVSDRESVEKIILQH